MKKIFFCTLILNLAFISNAQNEFRVKINDSFHDGIEFESLSFWTSFRNVVFGEGNGATLNGLYFESVNIPKNAIIDSAYLQFSSAENSNFSDSVFISIELNGDSEVFPGGGINILTPREKSQKWIRWDIEGTWKQNERSIAQRTPNLKQLVSEVMKLSEWGRGKPLTFFIDSERQTGVELWAFDSGFEEHYPELIIYYSLASNIDEEISSIHDELYLNPNPFLGKLVLNEEISLKENLILDFFNSLGEKIHQSVISGSNTVNVDFLPNGIYFVQIKSKNKILKTEKLIKVQ